MLRKDVVVRGAFWSAADTWGRQTFSLAIFLILARLLSAAEIGLFATAAIVFAIMQILVDDAIADALVQHPEVDDLHLDTAFWFNLAISVGQAILVSAGCTILARMFGEPELAGLIVACSVTLVLGSLVAVHQAVLRRALDYRTLAMRSVLSIVVAGAVGIGLAFAGFGVWSLAIQQIVERLVGLIVLWSRSDWRPRLRWSRRHLVDLIGFCAGMMASRVVMMLQKQVDRFVVAVFLGPAALGIYTLAMRIIDTMNALLVQVATNISLSTFSRLQNDPARMRHALDVVTEFVSLIAFPAYVGLAMVGTDAAVVVFGQRWVESGPVMQILAPIGIPFLIGSFSVTVVRAFGRPALFVYLLILLFALDVGLILALVRWGVVGTACGATAAQFLMLPVYFGLVKLLLGVPVPIYLRRFASATIASLIMALAIGLAQRAMLADLSSSLRLVASIGLGAAVYACALGVVGRPAVQRAWSVMRALRPAVPVAPKGISSC